MSSVDELYQAIGVGDVEQAKALLTTHNNLANSDAEVPPLIHWAIYQDKRQMVELLLDFGADIEHRDQNRDATPLDYAIVYGRKNIIPALLSRGASTEGRVQLAMKGVSGGFEEFSELPSRQDYEEIVTLLRDFGVND